MEALNNFEIWTLQMVMTEDLVFTFEVYLYI